MEFTGGDIPGWIACAGLLVDGGIRFFTWKSRRRREIESRRLSEADLKLMRAARESKGRINIVEDKNEGARVVVKDEVGDVVPYEDGPRTADHAANVSRLERLVQLRLFRSLPGFTYLDGAVRRFQLTDKGHEVVGDAPGPPGEFRPGKFWE